MEALINIVCPLCFPKKWVTEELSVDDYKAILASEMHLENIEYKTIYSLRTKEERPDEKAKNAYYIWEDVPEVIL